MKIEKLKVEKLTDDKLEFQQLAHLEAQEKVTLIVKVNEPNYVPEGFKVRSRVDEQMFTAECSSDDLAAARRDPHVVSLAPARQLRQIG